MWTSLAMIVHTVWAEKGVDALTRERWIQFWWTLLLFKALLETKHFLYQIIYNKTEKNKKQYKEIEVNDI